MALGHRATSPAWIGERGEWESWYGRASFWLAYPCPGQACSRWRCSKHLLGRRTGFPAQLYPSQQRHAGSRSEAMAPSSTQPPPPHPRTLASCHPTSCLLVAYHSEAVAESNSAPPHATLIFSGWAQRAEFRDHETSRLAELKGPHTPLLPACAPGGSESSSIPACKGTVQRDPTAVLPCSVIY